MNFFKNNKKSGFTLMEIAIAVMIVGVLLGLCGVIIKDQLKKSKDYSYYLAYRSVEKLGGQIVALGDPDETANAGTISKLAYDKSLTSRKMAHLLKKNTTIAKHGFRVFIVSIASKIAYSEEYIFHRLFPKSFATTQSTTIPSTAFTSDQVDDLVLRLKVCGGEKILNEEEPTITNDDGTTSPNYYKPSDFSEYGDDGSLEYDGCSEENLNAEVANLFYSDNCFKALCKNSEENVCEDYKDTVYSSVRVSLKNGSLNASGLCSGAFANYCATADGTTTFSTEFTAPDEDGVSSCMLNKTTVYEESSSGPAFSWDRPKVPSGACSKTYGYYNMVNTGGDYYINCECKTGYELSENDENVCCPAVSDNSISYALSNTADENKKCQACTTDFDQIYNKCCPDYSIYTGINDYANSTACSCVEGYTMKGGVCERTGCSKGATFDPVTKACITNPPILKAKRFCELIYRYWNTESHYCSGWTTSNNIEYNKSVFEAAKGTNGRYLSVVSKEGAFKNIKPNIVLSNGLKLWILSDKSASIPGLSYNPQNVTPSQNVCRNMNKSDKFSCRDATGGKGYFCKNENNCYNLDDRSLNEGKMTDARNCCATLDLTNIAIKDELNYEKQNVAFAINGFTIFVDIDGDKGDGTLWDDVYPFFVSANGIVYPGYPLDGSKNATTNSTSLYVGGNSASSLPTDVYYFTTDSTNNNRKKVIAYSAVSFARAACNAKAVSKYTPYCMNLGEKFNNTGTNPCDTRKCFIGVKNKLRFF